ncbi:MAG: hypothetical protein RL757_1971 [Bacteroidota bacterium]
MKPIQNTENSAAIGPELESRLKALAAKYAAMGQDLTSYLDGLLHADYLTYWDYIHLDTLLSLQTPRTPIADERIFIIYHQITELYFRLILDALEQIVETTERESVSQSVALMQRNLSRCNRYWATLIQSFEVMVEGMDKDEFLKFRMSLLPASGFQSVQMRKIEIMSTDLWLLVHQTKRANYDEKSATEATYENLYWKSGATELATGQKTLTLRQFEQKYSTELIQLGKEMRGANLRRLFMRLPDELKNDENLKKELREFDLNLNVRWKLSHFRSAARYLDNKPQTIAATGGTNWQQYLPSRLQFIVLFPELWNAEELENWGKTIR